MTQGDIRNPEAIGKPNFGELAPQLHTKKFHSSCFYTGIAQQGKTEQGLTDIPVKSRHFIDVLPMRLVSVLLIN